MENKKSPFEGGLREMTNSKQKFDLKIRNQLMNKANYYNKNLKELMLIVEADGADKDIVFFPCGQDVLKC